MAKKTKTVLKVPAKRKTTRVALVIDRSGSMSSVEKAAFDGINEQINVIRRDADQGGDTYVTYIQFDDFVETVFSNQHASELKNITRDQYSPRGSTAMRDAVGTAIEMLKSQTGSDEDVAYLVVTISDGAENASRQYTADRLAAIVKELKQTGRWTFTMMLSNVDLSVAKNLGVDLGNSVTYTSTEAGTVQAFAQMSTSTGNYFGARSTNTLSVNNFYSPTDAPTTTQNNAVVNVSASFNLLDS
jgi:Mg-chelatase subunit ChlD